MSQPNPQAEMMDHMRDLINGLINQAHSQWMDENKREVLDDDLCDDEEVQVVEEYITILKSYLN